MGDDRISNLINSRAKPSKRLLLAKELAIKYQKEEAIIWIDKELQGYMLNDDDLPAYRRIKYKPYEPGTDREIDGEKERQLLKPVSYFEYKIELVFKVDHEKYIIVVDNIIDAINQRITDFAFDLQKENGLICWNCGSINTENDTYCLACGKLLHNLLSADQADPNFSRIFNITRKDLISKEFTVTNNNHRKFTIQPKPSPHAWLHNEYVSVLLFTSFFACWIEVVNLIPTSLEYNIFVEFIGLGAMIVFVIGYFTVVFSSLIFNKRFCAEIDTSVDNQLIGKVKSTGIRHNKWIFTNNNDKAPKKYSMKFTSKTNGVINSRVKSRYNHSYYFSKSEKGLPPELDIYLDKTKVLKLLLGPEYEKTDQPQYKTYEIQEFQILAQEILDEDVVLFFVTVISNKFKTTYNTPLSKYFH